MATSPELFSPERYRDYLLGIARIQFYSWLGRRLEASDLVQEALLRAHQCRGQFNGTSEGEMKAWLRTILTSILANAIRHNLQEKRSLRKEVAIEAQLGESSARLDGWLQAPDGTPSFQARQHEQLDQLAMALEQLPESQQQVILCKFAEGLKIAQIGERLSLSVPAVAGLLRRGLARLRELLGEDAPRE